MNKEKVAVYIGRFQIAHTGHLASLEHAVKNYDHIIVLIGSAEIARDIKNPFTYEERKSVIEAMLDNLVSENSTATSNKRYTILPIHDFPYDNNKWLNECQLAVSSSTRSNDITLVGYEKDASSYYLKFFPQWKFDSIKPVTIHNKLLSSTSIRDIYFNVLFTREYKLPKETMEFLLKFRIAEKEIFEELCNEKKFIVDYQQQMRSSLPYPTIPFLTGDSLVVCAGNVLLIRRKTYPGKGLLALPGGFFNGNKDISITHGAIRELKEETKIKVKVADLLANIKQEKIFDDINRSLRWRIITKCVFIQLPYNTLPEVRGADDAESAFWMPICEIVNHRDQLFEDHGAIIDSFLNIF